MIEEVTDAWLEQHVKDDDFPDYNENTDEKFQVTVKKGKPDFRAFWKRQDRVLSKKFLEKHGRSLTSNELCMLSYERRKFCEARRKQQAEDAYHAYAATFRREFTLPPGEYIVGDPCYFARVVDTELYSSNSIHMKTNENPYYWYGESHQTLPDGSEAHMLLMQTADGDGEFDSSTGDTFDVDSGLIGIMSTDSPGMPVPDVHSMPQGTPIHAASELRVVFTREVIEIYCAGKEIIKIYISYAHDHYLINKDDK